jgi:hypothetical protein
MLWLTRKLLLGWYFAFTVCSLASVSRSKAWRVPSTVASAGPWKLGFTHLQSPGQKSGIERLAGVAVVSDVGHDGQGEVGEGCVAPPDCVGECRRPAESPFELADFDDVDGALRCGSSYTEDGLQQPESNSD